MNKSQIILAAIGGVSVVGALALGYFIWDATQAAAESEETLDGGVASASGIVRKLSVRPETKALSVYTDNVEAFDNWRAEAKKLAAGGDLVFEDTTPAVFKTEIVAEARRISALPGCLDGKLVADGFHFGFRNYIVGGELPPGDAKELRRLQREWSDVSGVLKTMAECGVLAITDVRVGKPKAVAADAEAEAAAQKAKNKKSKKGKAGKATTDSEPGPEITVFSVDFLARPPALVKALNAFATGSRFVVVDDFGFGREQDVINEAFGGETKRAEQTGGSRRRRRAQAQEEAEKPAEKTGIIIDPATETPLKMTMSFSVYDFGTLERARAEKGPEPGEAPKQGAVAEDDDEEESK